MAHIEVTIPDVERKPMGWWDGQARAYNGIEFMETTLGNVYECAVCRALVMYEGIDDHGVWHETTNTGEGED